MPPLLLWMTSSDSLNRNWRLSGASETYSQAASAIDRFVLYLSSLVFRGQIGRRFPEPLEAEEGRRSPLPAESDSVEHPGRSKSAGSRPIRASQWVTSLRAPSITASFSPIFLIKLERSLSFVCQKGFYSSSPLSWGMKPVLFQVYCFCTADVRRWGTG